MPQTFLHIGCGPKHKDRTTRGFNTADWAEIRLDIDATVQPDITGTMLDMTGVASASMDAIFSSHNIEHLYPHEVPQALAEFTRVLKPDGFLVVTCPDLQPGRVGTAFVPTTSVNVGLRTLACLQPNTTTVKPGRVGTFLCPPNR